MAEGNAPHASPGHCPPAGLEDLLRRYVDSKQFDFNNEGIHIDFCAMELYCIGHFVNSNISIKGKGETCHEKILFSHRKPLQMHYWSEISRSNIFLSTVTRLENHMMLAQSVAKGRNGKHNIWTILYHVFL